MATSESDTEDQNERLDDDEKHQPVKKIRKRKKRLFKAIREQMEFYFSDSNLAKDKFLWGLLSKAVEGYIDLTVFAQFKRIQALTTDAEDIVKALLQSELLEVSEDRRQVRRVTPVKEHHDVDERMIYVEHLPPAVDHNWLKSMFSTYGQVTYVSIPKFKSNGKIKGFAFIEFDTSEAATKACEHFGVAPDAPSKCQKEKSGDELPSMETVEKSSEDETSTKRKRKLDEDEELNKSKRSRVEELPEQADKKRKHDDVQDAETPPSKKGKPNDETVKLAVMNLDENKTASIQPKKKKKRKRTKAFAEIQEAETIQLRVLPKVEWKRLRNKYLALQKANMVQLKQSLCMQTIRQAEPKRANEWEFKANLAGMMVEEKMLANAIEYVPGAIVKLVPDSPLADPKQLKESACTLASVAYVEITDGEVTVRCKDAANAQTLLASEVFQKYGQISLLEGVDEQNYWSKIKEDREAKYRSKTRPKQRSRDKVIARAEQFMKKNQHIRFDE